MCSPAGATALGDEFRPHELIFADGEWRQLWALLTTSPIPILESGGEVLPQCWQRTPGGLSSTSDDIQMWLAFARVYLCSNKYHTCVISGNQALPSWPPGAKNEASANRLWRFLLEFEAGRPNRSYETLLTKLVTLAMVNAREGPPLAFPPLLSTCAADVTPGTTSQPPGVLRALLDRMDGPAFFLSQLPELPPAVCLRVACGLLSFAGFGTFPELFRQELQDLKAMTEPISVRAVDPETQRHLSNYFTAYSVLLEVALMCLEWAASGIENGCPYLVPPSYTTFPSVSERVLPPCNLISFAANLEEHSSVPSGDDTDSPQFKRDFPRSEWVFIDGLVMELAQWLVRPPGTPPPIQKSTSPHGNSPTTPSSPKGTSPNPSPKTPSPPKGTASTAEASQSPSKRPRFQSPRHEPDVSAISLTPVPTAVGHIPTDPSGSERGDGPSEEPDLLLARLYCDDLTAARRDLASITTRLALPVDSCLAAASPATVTRLCALVLAKQAVEGIKTGDLNIIYYIVQGDGFCLSCVLVAGFSPGCIVIATIERYKMCRFSGFVD
ncbi:hypothetical protein PAPYR_5926 [Paratrimastix pyriformis]|uniref:Uncharacterized protein n=1 Tax=Paratrimastix pyriformis TaxID=342808 RepID=A0ABQ8UJH3_9EUKA|nr:hypothetical protein PAPYR_5926 [Paratrimastix pyriformis]